MQEQYVITSEIFIPMYSSLVNQYIGATHSYVFVSAQSIQWFDSLLCIRLWSINTVVQLLPMYSSLAINIVVQLIHAYRTSHNS